MIKLFNVSKTYPGKIQALKSINFHVAKGEFVFIAGPSGAGKTTLLKLFFSAETADEGQIIVNGVNLRKIKRKMSQNQRTRNPKTLISPLLHPQAQTYPSKIN